MRDDEKRCTVCRAPLSLIPCSRCAIYPAVHGPKLERAQNSASSEPILIEGKYRLVEELGRGGMGMVFRALDTTLERSVAVKFLLPELQREPRLIESFRTEALAMASVQHPNVAHIYSYGLYGETPYFVMEFAGGDTVDQLLEGSRRRNSWLPLAEALHILDALAAGLAAVHDAGVVHRDVKPANVIYQRDRDRVVLMDFGLGHRMQRGGVVEPGVIGGSPAYMAPEIISGQAIPSETEYLADIYGLGITAFELITSVLPAPSETMIAALTWHLVDPPPLPSTLRPGLPDGLDGVILQCLEKDPLSRFARVDSFREALAPLIEEVKSWPRSPSRAPSAAPRVPLSRLAPPTPAPHRPGDRPASENPLIVVSGADQVLEQALKQLEIHAEKPIRVEYLETPAAALTRAMKGGANVIVAPLDDPLLNGVELAALIAGDPALLHLNVILTTREESPAETGLLERFGACLLALESADITGVRLVLEEALMASSGARSGRCLPTGGQ